MMLDRRRFALLAGVGVPAALATMPAVAQTAEPMSLEAMLAERSMGQANAPVTVIEYFSLTCGHCAAFHRDTMPRVRRELVQTGRMRMIFREFPLDGLALAAAQIARSLPVERYEPFITTLFASQDRWAFNRNNDPRNELFRLATFAGMSRADFDAAIENQDLARGILEMRVAGQQQHNVNSTPTFVFGTRPVAGNLPFDRFAALVAETR